MLVRRVGNAEHVAFGAQIRENTNSLHKLK